MSSFRKILFTVFICFSVFACSKVTQSNYDQIKQGMSMQQVVAILGEPTTSQAISIAGIAGTSATWRNKDAEIAIQFLNDQVTVKTFSSGEEVSSREPNTI